MSTILNETFTGASVVGDTAFDTETDSSSVLSFGSNAMTIDGSVSWAIAYVTLDSASSNYIGTRDKCLRSKWTFNLSDATLGVNKLIDMLRLYKATTVVLQTQLRSDGAQEGNFFRVVYDDSAEGANRAVDSSTFTVSDATDHTVELEVIMSSSLVSLDGSLKVWFDDTLVINETGIGWTDEFYDELRFGANNVTITTASSITYDNFMIASNRDFVDQIESFVIDNVSGTRQGLGSSSDPFRDMDMATTVLQAGDTLTFVNNGPQYPYRSVEDNGNNRFLLTRDGTASEFITVVGGGAIITNTINATEGGDYTWVGPDGNGEYHLTLSDDTTPAFPESPVFIAKCSASDWTSNGVHNLDTSAAEGTAGALALGEWDYASNGSFSTIFYKPLASEDMTTLHFEIPYAQAVSVTDSCITLSTNYYDIQDLKLMFAQSHGVELSSGGTGAFLTDIDASKCWVRGFKDHSAVTMINPKSHDNLWADQSGGFLFGDGVTGVKAGLYSYDNQDDGVEVSCGVGETMDFTIDGLISRNNEAGAGTDGHGIEVTIQAAGQTCRLYNATLDGNRNGLHIIMDAAGTVDTKNIISINNTGYGISDTSSAGTTNFATNSLYNNTGGNTNGAGYSSTGDVTTDPGITFNESAGTYTVDSDSPIIGAGTKTDSLQAGRNGEPRPSADVDIGALQFTYGAFHPVNL